MNGQRSHRLLWNSKTCSARPTRKATAAVVAAAAEEEESKHCNKAQQTHNQLIRLLFAVSLL
jgi:hypothetical protein